MRESRRSEPLDLWTDEKALDACAFQWAQLARRFKGVPAERLSFDLLNEPANVSEENYVRVVRRLAQAIRAEDPDRLIIADGLRWGRDPVFSLADLGIAQSTRGYDPMEISHYQASWIQGSDKWAAPTWPLKKPDGQIVDQAFLRKTRIAPWQELERKGVGIHVGEWGAHNRTPHAVALAWMRAELGTLAGSRLGLGPVESARFVRRARQRADRCAVRRIPRPQTRSRNAESLAGGLTSGLERAATRRAARPSSNTPARRG